MRWNLPITLSLVVHICILLAAVVVLPSPDEYDVAQQESVPVDIVTLEEFSKRQARQEKLPEPEKEVAPKVKVVPEIKKIAPKISEEIKQAAREPQPEPEPKPAPTPEPVVEQPPAPDPEPLEELIKQTEEVIPEPEAEPKKQAAAPVPKPRKKPKPPVRKITEKKPKKPDFNPQDVAALLNKIDETRATPPVTSVLDGAPKPDDISSLIGNDDRISANELDWLRQRIGLCWNVPAGARDAQNLIVKIRIQMDPLGNVTGQPRVINNSNHPVFDAAARSALAAIIGCQPYDKLSPAKYNTWKDMIINFDPSLMLAIN